jgi:hypothetical protein
MDYIKIGDESYPFNLGMAALAEIEKLTGQNTLLGVNFNNELVVACLYCGIKHGCRREKTKFTLTQVECADFIDEDIELITEILKLYRKQVLKDSEGEPAVEK